MASAAQDKDRKLSPEERKLVIEALASAEKLAKRAENSNTDEVLKNHFQTKAYAFMSLRNRFATTEMDFS